MNNSKNPPDLLMMTKMVQKGERIYPNQSSTPVAVARENFLIDEIGEFDYSVTYPVCHKDNILLLPGLKKNITIKKGKKCKNHKKNG
jgi:hypothetical protein